MTQKYALGYTRKSVAETETEAAASLGRQRAAIERVAENLNVTVKYYSDLESGRYEENRPGWQALLGDLNQNDPNCSGIIVEDYRSTHRNLKQFLSFHDSVLQPLGKKLIWAYFPNLDFSAADGRMMASLLMGIAEWESSKSSERMAATVAYKVQTLHRHWGPAPFGCGRDEITKHLIPSTRFYWYNPITQEARPAYRRDPSTRKVVPDGIELPPPWEKRYFHDSLRAIFDYYSNGHYSVAEVGHALNLAGWRHWEQNLTAPKPFNRQTVHSVIRHWQLYAGELPPSPTTPIKQHRNRPVLPGGHEPILPVELCERVGVVFQARHLSRRASDRSGYHLYLLSGLLYCGRCGQALGGQHAQHGRHYYYRHQYSKGDCTERMLPALDLEAEVLEFVERVTSCEPIFRQSAERLRALLLASEDEGDQAELQQRREDHERLIDLRITGAITRAEFDRRDGPLRAEIQRLEKTTVTPADAAEVDALIDEIMGPMGQLSEADPHQQKVMLREFIQRIKIVDGQIAAIFPSPQAAPLFDLFATSIEAKSEERVTWLDMFVILG